MTTQLRDHLRLVEAAIEDAKRLLAAHEYARDSRTFVLIGIIDQMIEHHAAMVLLISHDLVGSAFALTRSIVEGLYRGLWINVGATDEQVERFIKDDEIGMSMGQLAEANDENYRALGFFKNLKVRTWDGLNSYTHTGMLQLGRRFTAGDLTPDYSQGQILEVTTAITTCVLVLVQKFLAVRGHADESRVAERLISTYGPAQKLASGK